MMRTPTTFRSPQLFPLDSIYLANLREALNDALRLMNRDGILRAHRSRGTALFESTCGGRLACEKPDGNARNRPAGEKIWRYLHRGRPRLY